MARFAIQGGRRLGGVQRSPGNKNAALPMLAAALLTDEPVTLRNLPLIDDVRTMLALLEDLGVDVSLRGHRVTLRAAGIRKRRLNEALCRRVRTSVLAAGPMVARFGKAALFPPGGDVIGRRRLDTHFEGLRQLGIEVDGRAPYRFRRAAFRGAGVVLDEASVTATENVLMAAVLAPGLSTIFNAACEPHVQELCTMLNAMGAHISGIGTNRLHIEGVRALHGADIRIGPDYIDAVSLVAATIVTGGSLRLTDVGADPLQLLARPLGKLGVRWTLADGELYVPANQDLRIRNDYGSAVPKLEDGPWPAFPSDLLSIALVMATQATGTMLFFEKMFESRLYFVDRLIAMGARIVQCDPHRVIVSGPSPLHGTYLSSPDIRAGIALLIAALCANGRSCIANAESIDRGYENIERRLRALGADIRRLTRD